MNRASLEKHDGNYTGWNERVFNGLSSKGAKKGYRIAAELHNGVYRKDGTPYLDHINRSLQFYGKNGCLFHRGENGVKFDQGGMEKYLALHDVAEDHDNGISRILQDFGDNTLIKVLWMSEMNERIRKTLPNVVASLPAKRSANFQLFCTLIDIIKQNDPTNPTIVQSLSRLLPNHIDTWVQLWNSYFSKKYAEANSENKQKDIFAEWIFQGMLWNMPEDCFLVKCCERYDNLISREGLKNEKGVKSYANTAFTTTNSYLPRLHLMKYGGLGMKLTSEMVRGTTEVLS